MILTIAKGWHRPTRPGPGLGQAEATFLRLKPDLGGPRLIIKELNK